MTATFINSCEWQEFVFFQSLWRIQMAWRWGRRDQPADDRMQLGRRVERLAAAILRERGALVSITSHKAHFDIQANGATVEVKAARWDGRRYQWNLRDSQAELYLLACVVDDCVAHWFIVPAAALDGRGRNLACWAEDPAYTTGWLARYLETWELADRAIDAGAHPWQLPLFEEEVIA